MPMSASDAAAAAGAGGGGAAPARAPRSDYGGGDGQAAAEGAAAAPVGPETSPAQSSTKWHATFNDDDEEPFPYHFPQLSSHGSSMVHAVSNLRSTFSVSVLSEPPPQMFCYVLTACACLNSCNLGYDIGSVGGAALLMQEHLGWSEWELSFYVGSINFFCIIGAMNAGLFCDRFGRVKTFTMSCVIFIVGLLIQVLATKGSHSFAQIMVGRVIVGIGIGLGLSIDPLYISEVAPPSHRGHLVSFSEIAINLGILLGFIADYAFLKQNSSIGWRLMLGLGIVMPFILIILTFTIMPESPRWLLMQGRREEAIAVLQRTYPRTTNFERLAAEITDTIKADFEADHGSTWHAILRPSPVVALMLLAGIGLAAAQPLTGIESFMYFSQEILRKAGFRSRNASFGITIVIGVSKMLFTLVAVFYVDQAGRRPLLLLSNGGICLCLLLMAAAAPFKKLNGLMVFAVCLFMALFSIGIGPLTWVGTTEVFSTRIRAKALALAVSSNRVIAGLMAMGTLPLIDALTTSGYFVFNAVLCFAATIYIYMFFPETKEKTLEEVEHHFEEIVARKERSRKTKEAAASAAAVEDGVRPDDT